MHPKFHGDTYDFAKMGIIEGLAPLNEWAIHPMYYGKPRDPTFAGRYADFLGIRLVDGDIYRRDEIADVGKRCPQHLFVDPDTGLWAGQRTPRGGSDKHIKVAEFAEIANSPDRAYKLTLVYDQSFPLFINDKRKAVERKLKTMKEDYGLPHGAAYVAHVAFIWVSQVEAVVTETTERLLDKCGIPRKRFVGL